MSMKSDLRDIDGDLINHWYILALEREIPSTKPIRRIIYDVPYVLFRDEKNQICVFVDQCIHRGAPLSKGHCEKGQIRCPYHGWKFDSEGKLCDVPSEGESPKHPQNWALKGVPVHVQDGCVWIWPGEKNLQSAPPPWRFPEYRNTKFGRYFMITDFDNEGSHLVQNFMDVPHTVYVHDKWFRRRRLIRVGVRVDVGNARVKATYEQPQDIIGFMQAVLNPQKKPMFHTDEYIFPNITRVDYLFGDNGFIINSQCTPVSRYQTRVFTWIAYRVGRLTPLLLPFMKFYTRQVIMQDVQIMEYHGDVLKRLGENEPHSTGADELHIAIQKMRQLGTQDRNSSQTMSFSREREFWI